VTIPLARSSEETQLYLTLNPCACGQARFTPDSEVLANGPDLIRRYSGRCPDCGTARELLLRLPEQPLPPPLAAGEVWFGGDQPSELLDAGQWMWVADAYARLHPADAARLDPGELPRARADLGYAVAAMDEVAKFVPPDTDSVPLSAFWTGRGRQEYEREPYRFRRNAIDAVREAYREALARLV